MTIQTKHFIELSDIFALRFVRKYCDASLSVLLSDERRKTDNMKNLFLSGCPSCHRNCAEVGDSANLPLITRFAAALNLLRNTLENATRTGLTLVLEIKPEALPDQRKDMIGDRSMKTESATRLSGVMWSRRVGVSRTSTARITLESCEQSH
jgi:hypothetical protein